MKFSSVRKDGMASKAKQQKVCPVRGGAIITRLCSINSNGMVFLASTRLEVSSEVTLSVRAQAGGLDVSDDWEVHGLVVDCRAVRSREGLHYQVTLLFEEVPESLRRVLVQMLTAQCGYMPLQQAPVFGLN